MTQHAPALTVHVPHFDYEGRTLFDNFTLPVGAGAWTCLLGPSGCGKSTLLRLVAGLLDGATIADEDGQPVAGRLSFMAQNDGLLPWLSVIDNVTIGFRLRQGRTSGGARAQQGMSYLRRVGLERVANDLPSTLSGGMRQRVALARTLMEDRPVVLMDEPFSALDAITRHRLQDLVADLLSDRTVLLVTHSPMEALRLGHKIYVLHELPATLDEPMKPDGPTPRRGTDAGVLELQADLLERLTRAAESFEKAELQ